jgi:hypothetical protein
MCNLQPVTIAPSFGTGGPAEAVKQLRAEIESRTPKARALQGFFNSDWLTQALMSGLAGEIIDYIRGHDANRDQNDTGI